MDLNTKNQFGYQLYRDYRYPNDTVLLIPNAYDSIMTSVEELSKLAGYKVTEIIIFHT